MIAHVTLGNIINVNDALKKQELSSKFPVPCVISVYVITFFIVGPCTHKIVDLFFQRKKGSHTALFSK